MKDLWYCGFILPSKAQETYTSLLYRRIFTFKKNATALEPEDC